MRPKKGTRPPFPSPRPNNNVIIAHKPPQSLMNVPLMSPKCHVVS